MEPVTEARVNVFANTDVGNDPDDAHAIVLMMLKQTNLRGITTTHYNPSQKAGIAAKLCRYMRHDEIPVIPGYGCNPKKVEDFIAAYPHWPMPFKIPGFTNVVSLGQGKGYQGLEEGHVNSDGDASEAILEFSKTSGKSGVFLDLGPSSNLANVIDKCDEIGRIVLMGGYFGGKEVDGRIEISRPGYNTSVDPEAAKKVLTQTKHPVLVVNSQQVADWKFSWAQEEILAILRSEEKTELGQAMAKDMAYYWSHKKPKPYGNLAMADVLTALVAFRPELIKSTMAAEFFFNDMYYQNPETGEREPIHMLHPQAKTLFTVRKKDQSNVHILTELAKDPELIRKEVVEELATALYFKDKKSFEKAVQAEKERELNHEEISELIQKLYPDL